MKTYALLILLLFVVSFTSCVEEEAPRPECILESIELSPTNRLEFTTINGGQLYQVKQIVFADGRDRVLASFQYKYFDDSLIIEDQKNISSLEIPYLSVKMEGDRPTQIVRFSTATEIKVIYDIDYSDPEKVLINVTREDNIGNRLLFTYGTYWLDSDGNTSRFQQYFINTETLEEYELVQDVFFSYDDFTNPTRDLIVPYFTANTLPDPNFFNQNNQITIMDSNQVEKFSYTYGENDHTKTQTLPEGDEIIFNYINCQ